MFAFTSIAYHGFSGHFGGFHHGAGIMLGVHLLKFGLLAILGFTAVALAVNALNDWMDKRYPQAHFREVAGWGIFLSVLLLLGLLVTRVI